LAGTITSPTKMLMQFMDDVLRVEEVKQ